MSQKRTVKASTAQTQKDNAVVKATTSVQAAVLANLAALGTRRELAQVA